MTHVTIGLILILAALWLKMMLHWKYLKRTRPELRIYDSYAQYSRSHGTHDFVALWKYQVLSLYMLSPVFFWRKKDVAENKALIVLIWLVCLLVYVGLWLLLKRPQ